MNTPTIAVWIVLLMAIVAANLPWFSERLFFIFTPKGGAKKIWMRLLEWLLMYFLVGALALGLEFKLQGDVHPQDWEFYVVTLCLFMIFALPGFIYRHDLKRHLSRR